MKKVLKKIKEYRMLIVGIVGGILFGGGVYAATIGATNVSYSNSSSGIYANNVQDAIDKLYEKADNQYFDLATAQANSTGKIIASKKGICIYRSKTVYCFKANNWDVEKKHIQEVFSDVSCDVNSSYVTCRASDFGCYVDSNGYADCSDKSDHSNCRAYSDGRVICY